MIVKLTWSYSTTPIAQSPTKFTIQRKLTTASTYNTADDIVVTNLSSICTTGTCNYLYAGVPDNVSYDFRIATDCAEGSTNFSPSVTKINVLCPSVTVTATSNTISYSFSAVTGTSVTGYLVELLLNGTVKESKPLANATGTISGTFSGNSTPNDGIDDYSILATTSYVVRITVKSSGADKVCNEPITTGATPACNGAISLVGCICGVDCAQACS
jgi:hypothetical protein